MKSYTFTPDNPPTKAPKGFCLNLNVKSFLLQVSENKQYLRKTNPLTILGSILQQ